MRAKDFFEKAMQRPADLAFPLHSYITVINGEDFWVQSFAQTDQSAPMLLLAHFRFTPEMSSKMDGKLWLTEQLSTDMKLYFFPSRDG